MFVLNHIAHLEVFVKTRSAVLTPLSQGVIATLTHVCSYVQ